MHFGLISPPVPGHLNPFGALGRELISRGHRATLFHIRDLEGRAATDGIEFVAIGETSHPPGFLRNSLAKLGRLQGVQAVSFTIKEACGTSAMMLAEAPQAMRSAGVDAVLTDQTEPAGACIADYLGLPYVTVCNALLMNREPGVPPPFTPWLPLRGPIGNLRNRTGYWLSDVMVRPLRNVISKQRAEWNLPAYTTADESFSPLLQISQQVRGFDFPRRHAPSALVYTGPLRRPGNTAADFPWDRLNGRPLVYASLGTLQGGKLDIFRTFAAALSELPVQLVIAHGGALSEDATQSLPGSPVVVSYAPQTELLRQASLTLTHAGLNTALDSLSCGVPMIAVPITFEQPAIASRIRWSGSGLVLPLSKLNVKRLRAAAADVLSNSAFRANAQRLAAEIEQAGGVSRAADSIENVLVRKQSVGYAPPL